MSLLQEFAPVPKRLDGVDASSVTGSLVWNQWKLRAASIEDINRGYVLAPTPFAFSIVSYIIRNRDKIFQLDNRWLYILRTDNASQQWPPLELEDELTENIPLSRIYGKVNIAPAYHSSQFAFGRNERSFGLIDEPRTYINRVRTSFYGIGGIADPSIPFSWDTAIPKGDHPIGLAIDIPGVNLFATRDSFQGTNGEVVVQWFSGSGNGFGYYRNRARVDPNPAPIAPRYTANYGGRLLRRLVEQGGPNNVFSPETWIPGIRETIPANARDHMLVLRVFPMWKYSSPAAGTVRDPIPDGKRFILRITIGNLSYQLDMGDNGATEVVLDDSTNFFQRRFYEWQLFLPSSTSATDVSIDVWNPPDFGDDPPPSSFIVGIGQMRLSLPRNGTALSISARMKDIVMWPQAPSGNVNLLGTAVRIPKGSSVNQQTHLINTIPSGWVFADGFDLARVSDPVWIGIDILIRSGIPLSEIDWQSAVEASKQVEEPTGLTVDANTPEALDTLIVKPVISQGKWRFGYEGETITLTNDVLLRTPSVSIIRPYLPPPPRTVGIPFGTDDWIEVTRESNVGGYKTIQGIQTTDRNEALKEARRTLWPETVVTLNVRVKPEVQILVKDRLEIPESSRSWVVEEVKRENTSQRVIASWQDPARLNYIDTGTDLPGDPFIDEWDFIDIHGYVDG